MKTQVMDQAHLAAAAAAVLVFDQDGCEHKSGAVAAVARFAAALAGLFEAPELTTTDALARWNDAQLSAARLSDLFDFEGCAAGAALNDAAAPIRNWEEEVERSALTLLLTQAVWVKTCKDHREQQPSSWEEDRLYSSDLDLPGVVAAEEVAALLADGPLVLTRWSGPTHYRPALIARACVAGKTSNTLLVPAGALGFLDYPVTDVVLVGTYDAEVARRMEVLEALSTSGGAELAELWEVTADL